MEHALAAIHQVNPRRLPMEFGFARHQKNVTLLVRSPPELAATAASQQAPTIGPPSCASRPTCSPSAATPGRSTQASGDHR
jgi:hypothetical protein